MIRLVHAMPRLAVVQRLLPGIVLLALLLVAVWGGEPGQSGLLEAQAMPGSGAAAASSPEIEASAVLSNTLFLPSMLRSYPCTPHGGVHIDGPDRPTIGEPVAYTASAMPVLAGLPVTYTWQVTGHDPIVVVGGAEDVQTFSWELADLAGDKLITVQVERCGGTATDTLVARLSTRGLVAFERHYCDPEQPEKDEYCEPHDIWLTTQDGSGGELNLTNTPDVDEGVPTWSPDGDYLAYAAGRLGSKAIHKRNVHTGEVTILTDGTNDEHWPAWSPLGDRIAFVRKTPGEMYDVYVMNTDGSGLLKLTTWPYSDRFPAWSRDGQWIAFSSDRFYASEDLYIVRPDDPDSVRLVLQTNDPGQDNNDRADEIYPSWSPDGWIYYTFAYQDAPADGTEYLYRIRPDGSGKSKVFDDSYERWIPSFSPDGQCFTFYSKMGGIDKEVWKWCAGMGAAVNLTDNPDHVGDEYSAWSPVP